MALVNAVLVRYATGYLWVEDAGSISSYGRREGFLSLGSASSSGEAQRTGEAILAQRSTPEVAVSAGMEPVGGVAPYASFDVADHINVPDETGTPASMRVVAVTVSEDDEGNPIYVPELQTLNQELDQRLAQALKAMGNGTLGGTALSASPAPLVGSGVSSDPTGSWPGSGVSGPDGGAGSVGVETDPDTGGSTALHDMPDVNYISGRYYGPAATASGNETAAVAAGQLYLLPFVCRRTTTFDRIGIHVFTGVASSNVRLGIYDSDSDGLPDALVLDAGAVATATSNASATITISQELTAANLYWLAAVFSHTPTVNSIAAASMWAFGGNSGLNVGGPDDMFGRAFAYGALPNPAAMSGSNLAAGVRVDIRLRAA